MSKKLSEKCYDLLYLYIGSIIIGTVSVIMDQLELPAIIDFSDRLLMENIDKEDIEFIYPE